MSLFAMLPVVLLLLALSCTAPTIHASVEKTLSLATTRTTAAESVSMSTSAAVTTVHVPHSSSSSTTTTTAAPNAPIHNNVLSHVAARTPLLNLEGIDLQHFKTIQGHRAFLNGAGTRAIRFMGMNFKVYVAALYAVQHVDTAEAIMERFNHNQTIDNNDNNDNIDDSDDDECLYQMDFTFLRSVGQSKVTQAWSEQLEYSVTHTYDGYEKDRDAFIAMFGPIQNGGTETVQLIGHDTVVYDQGEYKGVIKGRDFQKAFLSVWFGENSVAADLKAGLLGKVVLDEKNLLVVLRAAAATDEGGNGPHRLKEEEIEGSSAWYTTDTTATMAVLESPSPPTCDDEQQPELCHE
jgi:Chalcone isomerase-like